MIENVINVITYPMVFIGSFIIFIVCACVVKKMKPCTNSVIRYVYTAFFGVSLMAPLFSIFVREPTLAEGVILLSLGIYLLFDRRKDDEDDNASLSDMQSNKEPV